MFRKLSISTIKFCHRRQIDKFFRNNQSITALSICHNHQGDQKNDRIEFYLKDLLENKLISSDKKSLNDIKNQIAIILERFDYGIYEHNINFDEFDPKIQQKLHLKSEEIFEILSQQTDDNNVDDRLINYYINNRRQLYEKYFRRLDKLRQEQNQDNDDDDDGNRSGIWSNQGELKYGLWHNCLFTKMKRSSTSHLFDRRLTSMAMYCPSTPRLLIDLNYVMEQDFFQTKKILDELRYMLAMNKYRTIQPFRIEFLRSNHQRSSSNRFDKIVSNFFTWWNDPKQYQYVVHNHTKPIELLQKKEEKLIYFTPNAKIPVKISELLDTERNILVIPGHYSRNLRDPVFNRINRLANQSKSILVRRLPTIEHIVWNKFHGVISWTLFLSILHDICQNPNDNWNNVFKRYLLEMELIKSDSELSREMNHAQQIRMKREQQIQNFIHSKTKQNKKMIVEKKQKNKI